MFNKSNINALGFALLVCLICSGILSFAADTLRPRQERNVEIDMKKNILKALKITDKENATPTEVKAFFSTVTADAIESIYKEQVRSFVIDSNGKALDKTVESLSDAEKLIYRAVYKHVKGETILAYAIPTSGKALWSTCYGYFALENDLNTVKGITFYQHGETPGLGAEIATDWFQDNYVGKKILNEAGELKSVTIIKGAVTSETPEAAHKVDGIAGATMTGNGVNSFLKTDLEIYNKYFETVRSGTDG